jgi:hypothetical protein
MLNAKLGRNGTDVQCGRCSVKLGELASGQGVVAERGGPALGTARVAVGVLMVSGYLPRDDLGGLWVNAAHGKGHAKFSHGDKRNFVLEFPARTLCYRCGAECVIGAPSAC